MASPPSEAEDRNVRGEGGGSGEVNRLSNLSIGDSASGLAGFGDLAAMGGEKGANSTLTQSNKVDEDNVSKESSPDVNQSSGVSDSGTGPRMVEWSSFNSDANAHQVTKSSSYSDFFNEFGDDSEDPFANLGSKGNDAAEFNVTSDVSGNLSSGNHLQNHEGHGNYSGSGQGTDSQDSSNSQYWENLYPGWRYDHSTGQWYQLEGYDANATANGATSNGVISSQSSDVSRWSQISHGGTEYPAHMVFDPQYPGWYYDTIAQEWRTFDHSTNLDYNQQYQGMNFENHGSQGSEPQTNVTSLGESKSQFGQNMNMWRMGSASENGRAISSECKQLRHLYGSTGHLDNLSKQHQSHTADSSNKLFRCQSFSPSQEYYSQHYNQSYIPSSQHMQNKPSYFDTQKSFNYSHDSLQSGASAGRPPHALVTFGFGGKLIVMKNGTLSSTSSPNGSQDSLGYVVNVLNLMEVVMENTGAGASCFGLDVHDYFRSLCQQSFPGPLVGGNVGNKEVNRWIDERIANFESLDLDQRRREPLRLLISLLKISCQYYGKLRSPFGTDETLKESDYPEAALAKLFRSVKGNWVESGEYGIGALQHCLQNLPSQAHIQATAFEVQRLLVSGRKREAFECAQEGQLWGPALVLASQLGDQFFGETVKQMAVKQLMAGSPLRTLCLLIAGQPADVFALPGYVDNSHYPQPAQFGAHMLDDWEENLAVITANRTKDDALVIIHLGDSLWKERGEVIAAHICYLVAEANFEPYSDSSRLCLIGSDHWKYPRTYASPAAIQRTEVYEFSKLLGNSQFLLLPFQPYKLIYACMLAEVGKVADSLKYCQAILKSQKTGRAPEVDSWKQLVYSLEERLRIHQQGGYSYNLASTKIVGKLLTFFDSTANRVVGGLRPPVPSASGNQLTTSTPTPTPIPSLMPSLSMEPIRDWGGQNTRSTMPNRSVSEPDLASRSPRKANIQSETKTQEKQEKTEASGGSSRFGRFGSQLFQKTVGLVLRSRPNRQAKLGEENKFYYDEKLKRWVEEGVEPSAEETTLTPPPTTSASKDASGPEISPGSSERNLGIPPIPPSSNQTSTRARTGVRSRYVDTFNKSGVGGMPGNLFSSPSIKPVGGSNPKLFIPARVTRGENQQEAPKPAVPFMQRFPSMNYITRKEPGVADENESVPNHPHRRTVSWSEGIISSPREPAMKPLAEVLGTSFFSPSPVHQHDSVPDLGDDLHELTL